MNRLNNIKISRFLNQNTDFCKDWRNQIKAFVENVHIMLILEE